MAALNYTNIYALQDKGLAPIFSAETTFYLTGDTCLNRFYHNRRYSDDLDLFTNENALFHDDVPEAKIFLLYGGPREEYVNGVHILPVGKALKKLPDILDN